MASTFPGVVVLALFAIFAPCIFAWPGDDCLAYTDFSGKYYPKRSCGFSQFCCGSCYNRYCCQDNIFKLSEDKQDDCDSFTHTPVLPMVLGIGGFIFISLIFILCCVCPCCCLYKACRRPRPVIATTTHTTVVTAPAQTYPQQPTAVPQPYQGAQYPAYQPVPVQPGYGTQPMPYQGAPYAPGPPPTYHEATIGGPAYPPGPMPYSQAAYSPGQPSYPLQPPAQAPVAQPAPQPQPMAPHMDFLSQPAFNPDYVPNKM